MKKITSFSTQLMTKMRGLTLFLACALIATSVHADYDIGGPGEDTPLGSINAFIQEVVNFVSGPIALSFSFLSIVGMAFTWAIAPKFIGAMGLGFRVMIAVIIALNVGAWLAAYAGESSGIASIQTLTDLLLA